MYRKVQTAIRLLQLLTNRVCREEQALSWYSHRLTYKSLCLLTDEMTDRMWWQMKQIDKAGLKGAEVSARKSSLPILKLWLIHQRKYCFYWSRIEALFLDGKRTRKARENIMIMLKAAVITYSWTPKSWCITIDDLYPGITHSKVLIAASYDEPWTRHQSHWITFSRSRSLLWPIKIEAS